MPADWDDLRERSILAPLFAAHASGQPLTEGARRTVESLAERYGGVSEPSAVATEAPPPPRSQLERFRERSILAPLFEAYEEGRPLTAGARSTVESLLQGYAPAQVAGASARQTQRSDTFGEGEIRELIHVLADGVGLDPSRLDPSTMTSLMTDVRSDARLRSARGERPQLSEYAGSILEALRRLRERAPAEEPTWPSWRASSRTPPELAPPARRPPAATGGGGGGGGGGGSRPASDATGPVDRALAGAREVTRATQRAAGSSGAARSRWLGEARQSLPGIAHAVREAKAAHAGSARALGQVVSELERLPDPNRAWVETQRRLGEQGGLSRREIAARADQARDEVRASTAKARARLGAEKQRLEEAEAEARRRMEVAQQLQQQALDAFSPLSMARNEVAAASAAARGAMDRARQQLDRADELTGSNRNRMLRQAAASIEQARQAANQAARAHHGIDRALESAWAKRDRLQRQLDRSEEGSRRHERLKKELEEAEAAVEELTNAELEARLEKNGLDEAIDKLTNEARERARHPPKPEIQGLSPTHHPIGPLGGPGGDRGLAVRADHGLDGFGTGDGSTADATGSDDKPCPCPCDAVATIVSGISGALSAAGLDGVFAGPGPCPCCGRSGDAAKGEDTSDTGEEDGDDTERDGNEDANDDEDDDVDDRADDTGDDTDGDKGKDENGGASPAGGGPSQIANAGDRRVAREPKTPGGATQAPQRRGGSADQRAQTRERERERSDGSEPERGPTRAPHPSGSNEREQSSESGASGVTQATGTRERPTSNKPKRDPILHEKRRLVLEDAARKAGIPYSVPRDADLSIHSVYDREIEKLEQMTRDAEFSSALDDAAAKLESGKRRTIADPAWRETHAKMDRAGPNVRKGLMLVRDMYVSQLRAFAAYLQHSKRLPLADRKKLLGELRASARKVRSAFNAMIRAKSAAKEFERNRGWDHHETHYQDTMERARAAEARGDHEAATRLRQDAAESRWGTFVARRADFEAVLDENPILGIEVGGDPLWKALEDASAGPADGFLSRTQRAERENRGLNVLDEYLAEGADQVTAEADMATGYDTIEDLWQFGAGRFRLQQQAVVKTAEDFGVTVARTFVDAAVEAYQSLEGYSDPLDVGQAGLGLAAGLAWMIPGAGPFISVGIGGMIVGEDGVAYQRAKTAERAAKAGAPATGYEHGFRAEDATEDAGWNLAGSVLFAGLELFAALKAVGSAGKWGRASTRTDAASGGARSARRDPTKPSGPVEAPQRRPPGRQRWRESARARELRRQQELARAAGETREHVGVGAQAEIKPGVMTRAADRGQAPQGSGRGPGGGSLQRGTGRTQGGFSGSGADVGSGGGSRRRGGGSGSGGTLQRDPEPRPAPQEGLGPFPELKPSRRGAATRGYGQIPGRFKGHLGSSRTRPRRSLPGGRRMRDPGWISGGTEEKLRQVSRELGKTPAQRARIMQLKTHAEMQFVDKLRQTRLEDLEKAYPWKKWWDVVEDVDDFPAEFLEGTLRINKVTGPCEGCNRVIPRLMPPSSKMWVEWADKAGNPRRGYFESGFEGLVQVD